LKSLIRFEDTYGLTDIFCARNDIDYIDISLISQKLIELKPGLFIDFGLGAGWGKFSTDEAYAIMERGIERIIFVYDMDNLDGDKEFILQKEQLTQKINDIENIFNGIGYNVEICFIPVVYAAETLMLYQYLDDKYGIRITNVVSSVNTNYLHLCLLSYLIKEVNVKHAKRVRNFLDITKLIEAFKSKYPQDINYMTKNWIIDGCNLDEEYIFDKYEAIRHLEDTKKLFEKWKNNSNREIEIDGHIIKLNRTVKPLLSI